MEQLFTKVLNPKLNKILAIGKNYVKHVKEMGGSEVPKEPVIFQKPHSSVLPNIQKGSKVQFFTKNEVHHEIELGFMMSKEASHKSFQKSGENWQDYVGGYFLALDLTDRNLQAAAKKAGFPWDLSKGQDKFLPISSFIPKEKVQDPYNLTLHLRINGKTIQKDNTGIMHFKIKDQIEYASKFMTLYPGDLFLTGTPDGVGPIKHGDHVVAELLEGDKVLAQIDFVAEMVAPSL
ncbi:hypothetical protein ABPG74_022707 [Tetrahymena malaccensis]